MSASLVNAAISLAIQLPFVIALGLYFDVFRHHNFALGAVYAAALCLFVRLFAMGAPLWFSVMAIAAICLLLLVAIQFLILEPMRARRSADEILIATLGINIVVEQALSVSFGDRIRFPSLGGAAGELAWFLTQPPTIVALVLGLAVTVATFGILKGTEPGLRLIALGESPLLFRSLSFQEKRWQLAALCLVSGVICLSALGAVNLLGAYPSAGFPLVVLGLLTRLAGGPVHRIGFLVAGVAVIGFDQLSAILLPGEWRTVILFGALLLLIAIRSQRVSAP